MISFKSKRNSGKPDVWTSEMRLKACDANRRARVNRLLQLLDREGFDETLS